MPKRSEQPRVENSCFLKVKTVFPNDHTELGRIGVWDLYGASIFLNRDLALNSEFLLCTRFLGFREMIRLMVKWKRSQNKEDIFDICAKQIAFERFPNPSQEVLEILRKPNNTREIIKFFGLHTGQGKARLEKRYQDFVHFYPNYQFRYGVIPTPDCIYHWQMIVREINKIVLPHKDGIFETLMNAAAELDL